MADNSFTIAYDSTMPTTAYIEVDNADHLWVTFGLNVEISLRGPSSFSATHYKLWGIDGVTSSGGASWNEMPTNFVTVTGTLDNVSTTQQVYAQFKDGGSNNETVTSSGVVYDFDSDINTHHSVTSSVLQTGGETSNTSYTLQNTNDNIDVEYNKANIDQLRFDGLDLADLIITGDTISAAEGTIAADLLQLKDDNHVVITKVFSADETPFIRVDTGSGFVTLTDYNGDIKSTVSGDYLDRINTYNWDSGTKTLSFNVKKFSTYGFCTLNKIEFTNDSQDAGYLGTSINIKVEVTDTNGEGVENAPVTFSGTGDNIGSLVSDTVNTDAQGIAIAVLNVTSTGMITYDAYVDSLHTDPDQDTYGIAVPASLQRSLLTQYEQIRFSATYDDAVASVNTSDIAEPNTPTTSGIEKDTLEHDTNVFRTLLKQVKGGTYWYDDPGMYFDPTSTTSGSTNTKQMSLENIKGNTLDSKTIIVAVSEDNSGAGYTVSTGVSGILFAPTDARYADPVDRRGLPIFTSTANNGSYWDEGGSDDVCIIDLLDTSNGVEFKDSSNNLIYAKFHDGSDFSGAGEGTDVYVRFYTSVGPYVWTAGDPTNIKFVFPFRRVLDEMEEYEWHRTDFISSWEGDEELLEDISNLWSYTGSSNNDTIPSWSDTENYYTVSSGTDLQTATDDINTGVGDRIYTEDNYLTDGETITASLDALDEALQDVADSVSAGTGEKYIEEVSVDISADTLHDLPGSITYTPVSTVGIEGRNMDVYVNGQLLAADTGVGGVNVDRDYGETTVSGITFHKVVYQDSNITYTIRQ